MQKFPDYVISCDYDVNNNVNTNSSESFSKSKVSNFLIYTLTTIKLLSIYQIQTKTNPNPCASLIYNSVWNFLYSPYRFGVYFTESNNTLKICSSVK